VEAVAQNPTKPLVGRQKPRIAPPMPARSKWQEFRDFAKRIDLELFPWQEYAGRYLNATTPDDRWLYREVAVIVARQNGKTTLLVPLIVQRLLDGQRVMHTAQNAKLPRDVHDLVATTLQEHFPDELPRKRAISYAVGHESIRMKNGGEYRIVAPTKGGARGPSNDLVIVDELREMVDFDFIAAAKPTLTASSKPQMVYLSNAGSEASVVLNALRKRADEDPSLAYLEWSADADRAPDDTEGWRESNPSLGHIPAIYETLVDDYRTAKLEGTLAIFETEHLCRWVKTMRERLVDEAAWMACAVDELDKPRRPQMAVSVAPDHKRASVALAWQQDDGTTALRLLYEVRVDEDGIDAFGNDLRRETPKHGVVKVGYDPLTDAGLAKHFRKAEKIGGTMFAQASAHFVTEVSAGRIRWHDADVVTEDLVWTARKALDEGRFEAVRADDKRPITAALAAIRAVWLASGPRPRVRAY
jgi:hypothetical protein